MGTTATARVRELSRGRGGKTAALDAAAAAAVAALQGDAEPLQPEDATAVLAVVEERRSNLVGQPTPSVNQLHAVLGELIAGGGPPKLSADKAAALLGRVRPLTAADHARNQVARDLVAEIRGLDRRLTMIGKRLQEPVTALGSRLPETSAWARHRRAAAWSHRSGIPLPHRCPLRQLHRGGAARGRQRRARPTSAVSRR